MNVSYKFICSIFVILFLILPFSVVSQSGTIKTRTGYLLYANTNTLHWTLRLDEPNSELPYWIDVNKVQLLKNHLYIEYFNNSFITKNSKKTPLFLFQKWETDYIDKTFNPNIKRSPYLVDTSFMKLKSGNLVSNAWYYFLDTESEGLAFYFFDIYENNNFIRISYIGVLENAQLFISAVLNGIRFHNKMLDIPKLQSAIRNGEYFYNEN